MALFFWEPWTNTSIYPTCSSHMVLNLWLVLPNFLPLILKRIKNNLQSLEEHLAGFHHLSYFLVGKTGGTYYKEEVLLSGLWVLGKSHDTSIADASISCLKTWFLVLSFLIPLCLLTWIEPHCGARDPCTFCYVEQRLFQDHSCLPFLPWCRRLITLF